MVENLSANAEMPEMWVRSLGWEDPLEKEMAPAPVGAWQATVHRVRKSHKESDTTEATEHSAHSQA